MTGMKQSHLQTTGKRLENNFGYQSKINMAWSQFLTSLGQDFIITITQGKGGNGKRGKGLKNTAQVEYGDMQCFS